MLSIKLKRIGKKHQPSFRIVVAEKRSKLTGKFVEDLGWYNPRTKEVKVNKERIDYRLKNGAQPTDSVYNLLVRLMAISGPKRIVHKKSKKSEKTETLPETAIEKENPKQEEEIEMASRTAPKIEQAKEK